MRIVSQCGQADFPYERTYILSDRENVKAVCDGNTYMEPDEFSEKKWKEEQ